MSAHHHEYRDRTFIDERIVVDGKAFIDERIVVDGKAFIDCVFDGCVLVYACQAPAAIERYTFIDCKVEGPGWPLSLLVRDRADLLRRPTPRHEPEVLMSKRGARLPRIDRTPSEFWKTHWPTPRRKSV